MLRTTGELNQLAMNVDQLPDSGRMGIRRNYTYYRCPEEQKAANRDCLRPGVVEDRRTGEAGASNSAGQLDMGRYEGRRVWGCENEGRLRTHRFGHAER